MKKLVSIFLASALLLTVLAGCGFSGSPSNTQTPGSAAPGESTSGPTTRNTLV